MRRFQISKNIAIVMTVSLVIIVHLIGSLLLVETGLRIKAQLPTYEEYLKVIVEHGQAFLSHHGVNLAASSAGGKLIWQRRTEHSRLRAIRKSHREFTDGSCNSSALVELEAHDDAGFSPARNLHDSCGRVCPAWLYSIERITRLLETDRVNRPTDCKSARWPRTPLLHLLLQRTEVPLQPVHPMAKLSSREKCLECFARTGVYVSGTMFPSLITGLRLKSRPLAATMTSHVPGLGPISA